MLATLTLSRGHLHAFLECKRQFELRYLRHLPWPDTPLPEKVATAVSRGQQFHQLLERHFLGLPIEAQSLEDNQLQQWWHAFRNSDLVMPDGRYLPEHRLTIPAGNHFLLGRFDLLVIGENEGEPFAHLFDWKTSFPREVADLYADWQTRLYLAMLAESSAALLGGTRTFKTANIGMTYWYVKEPDQPRTIFYDQAKHTTNWAEILQILADLDKQLTSDVWSLAETWKPCAHCSYQVYCGRQVKQPPPTDTILFELDEEIASVPEQALAPETP